MIRISSSSRQTEFPAALKADEEQREVRRYLAQYRERHPDYKGPVYVCEEKRDATVPA